MICTLCDAWHDPATTPHSSVVILGGWVAFAETARFVGEVEDSGATRVRSTSTGEVVAAPQFGTVEAFTAWATK